MCVWYSGPVYFHHSQLAIFLQTHSHATYLEIQKINYRIKIFLRFNMFDIIGRMRVCHLNKWEHIQHFRGGYFKVLLRRRSRFWPYCGRMAARPKLILCSTLTLPQVQPQLQPKDRFLENICIIFTSSLHCVINVHYRHQLAPMEKTQFLL